MFLYVKLLMNLSELFICHMRIDLSRRDIFMSEKFLDRPEIGTISEEGSGKGVSYGMSRNGFDDTCPESSIRDHFCDQESVKTYFVRSSINREVLSMFDKKRREVVFPFFQIRSNRLTSPFCEIHNANFSTFTENSEFLRLEIDVLHIERGELGDAQTSTKNSQNNSSVAQVDDIFISDRCYY